MEKDLYRSAMSLTMTADIDGNAGLENVFYRSAISLIMTADIDGNAGLENVFIDQLCHRLWLMTVKRLAMSLIIAAHSDVENGLYRYII